LNKIEFIVDPLLSWYRDEGRPLPWRRDWQKHRNPYHVWVSEIMLQQTLLSVVVPFYETFVKHFPDLKTLAKSEEEDVKKVCAGLGYYRRFRHMHLTANRILRDSMWPETFEQWLDLPGIGHYTAAAVSSITLNLPKLAVDGNIERVFARLLDIRLPSGDRHLKKMVQSAGQKLILGTPAGDFNQALMEFGQRICRKFQSKCEICFLSSCCQSYAHQSQDLAPMTKKRRKPEFIELAIIVPQRENESALFKRDKNSPFLKESTGFYLEAQTELCNQRFPCNKTIGQFCHHIMHYNIQAKIFTMSEDFLLKTVSICRWQWYSNRSVFSQLTTSLDQKTWRYVV